MRGSIGFQTGRLADILFIPGLSKKDQKETGFLANSNTIQKYKEIWKGIGNYSQTKFGIKDLQNLTSAHIHAFMEQKVKEQVSEQYLEFISSLIGKLQIALTKLNDRFCSENERYKLTMNREYDFSIRKQILSEARKQNLVLESADDPEFCRAYENPELLIEAISNPLFQLAARIQLQSGARLEGVQRIDKTMMIQSKKLKENALYHSIEYHVIDEKYSEVPQLQEIIYDTLEAQQKGSIFDVEKGGKPGILLVEPETYQQLKEYLLENECFKIDISSYRKALKEAAMITFQPYNGTHGLRWNFARRRFYNIQVIGGLTYEQALQQVSWEMKHERASITEHYLRYSNATSKNIKVILKNYAPINNS